MDALRSDERGQTWRRGKSLATEILGLPRPARGFHYCANCVREGRTAPLPERLFGKNKARWGRREMVVRSWCRACEAVRRNVAYHAQPKKRRPARDPMEDGARLAALLQGLRWTMPVAAKHLHVSRTTVANVLRGRYQAKRGMLAQMAVFEAQLPRRSQPRIQLRTCWQRFEMPTGAFDCWEATAVYLVPALPHEPAEREHAIRFGVGVGRNRELAITAALRDLRKADGTAVPS